MRSLKTSGGLTRGRGMTELQQVIWLLSTPTCAELNHTMQELTGVTYVTSEQHKESSQTRMVRDYKDASILVEFLLDRNPFTSENLINIVTGENAAPSVNVDNAKEIGESIIKVMNGKKVNEYSSKKKDQAMTLASKATVKIGDEVVSVDPQLLFQRLVFTAKGMGADVSLEDVFSHELCSYPTALFERVNFLLPANKPQLSQAISKHVEQSVSGLPEEVRYVLDGGSLLQRLPWQKGQTYGEIIQTYVDYITKRFGEETTVVFDGYSSTPSTKDVTHLRRTKEKISREVQFTKTSQMNMKKQQFLANTTNKQNFINMLSSSLREVELNTVHASDDADSLIVKTAVEIADAFNKPTAVIGEDTDLLILLLNFVNKDGPAIYMMSDKKSTKSKIFFINEMKTQLGETFCKNVLFMHAFLGCDTTSRIYSIGKGVIVKKFIEEDLLFQKCAEIFNNSDSTIHSIIYWGEKVIL